MMDARDSSITDDAAVDALHHLTSIRLATLERQDWQTSLLISE
jgi:hypothetical protein